MSITPLAAPAFQQEDDAADRSGFAPTQALALDGLASRGAPLPLHRGWLARLEAALDRLLPGTLGSLLQLFVCVSLAMAMISALLPMVDRI